MLPQSLTNFEIQKYYQNELRFNGVYSRDNMSEIKDGAYLMNTLIFFTLLFDTSYVHNNNVIYFDSFGVEHNKKEIKAFINRALSKTTNIFRIQAYYLILCGYFCIWLIDFMLEGKTLTQFTNLFSPNFKKNDDIILNYFMSNV